ncbi:dihydrolipoyl dehydrogenase family protein [Agromyces bracchium]|uniref:Pyridine nucleotide-disulfide oxidoreductase n=1 Tax=Agromyces bracchium TaxID=88376 RepID=A0A6I3M5R7_9MICO|nr:NAD(P)/FAD-dependent oxidoreductase [Agromyces bracchium]MTH68819.1 pyridine nucleotide-disulfide oxidoreductase [Agromyces bracchium]
MAREFDLVVLGAGPVGENVVDRARAAGLEVAVVEHELVGGECSYWACVPSKTLLRSGAALRAARRVRGASDAVTGDVDVAETLARRDYWVSDWDDRNAVAWLESVGAVLVRGHGRLQGERRVVVTPPDGGADEVLVARHAVAVCTGSEPVVPDVPGLADARPWISRDATGVRNVPARLAIIGGGVVAVEMATLYAGFGTRTTMIVRHGLLGGMEPFAGEAVADGLRALGVELRQGASPVRVSRDETDAVVIELDDGGTVTADEVLVATGRRPRSTGIGVEAVGLEPGSSITVDDTLAVVGLDEASAAARNDVDDGDGDRPERMPWLYAVGDVTGRASFTHQGKYQGRAAGDVIAARALGRPVDAGRYGIHTATADSVAVPSVVFADPEVGSVGLTAARAAARGLAVRTPEVAFSSVTGAGILADDYEGRARLVIDDERDVVVGATFVGPDVAELVHQATIAIVGEVPVRRLWHAVPAFPTMSEVWLRLLEADGRPEVGG